MKDKRGDERQPRSRGRKLLYIHALSFMIVTLFLWWDFVNALYGSGFFFSESLTPLGIHATWTGLLLAHFILFSLVSAISRRRRRKTQDGASESATAEAATLTAIHDELRELRRAFMDERDHRDAYRPQPLTKPAGTTPAADAEEYRQLENYPARQAGRRQ